MTNNYGLATLGAGLLAGCAHTPARYVETLGQPFEGTIEHGFVVDRDCFNLGIFGILSNDEFLDSAYDSSQEVCGEGRKYTEIKGDGNGPNDVFFEVRQVSTPGRNQLAVIYQEDSDAKYVVLDNFEGHNVLSIVDLDTNKNGIFTERSLTAIPYLCDNSSYLVFSNVNSTNEDHSLVRNKKAEHLSEVLQTMEEIDSAMGGDGLSVAMLLRDEEFRDSLDMLLQETPKRVGR